VNAFSPFYKHFDDDFSTEFIKGNNPYSRIKMSPEGFLFMGDD